MTKKESNPGARDNEEIVERLLTNPKDLKRAVIRGKFREQAQLADTISNDLRILLKQWSHAACDRLNRFFEEVARWPEDEDAIQPEEEGELDIYRLLQIRSASDLVFAALDGQRNFEAWLLTARAQYERVSAQAEALVQESSGTANALYERLAMKEADPKLQELSRSTSETMWARLDSVPSGMLIGRKSAASETNQAGFITKLTSALEADRAEAFRQANEVLAKLDGQLDRLFSEKLELVRAAQLKVTHTRHDIESEGVRRFRGPRPDHQ